MRTRVVPLIALVLVLAGCSGGPSDPESWQSEEYRATLPAETGAAFVAHARYAVGQEVGRGTFVDLYPDNELLALAELWCDDPSPYSSALGEELERRGVDLNPGRSFLPPPPIDLILVRVADMHQPQLCQALA